MTDPCKFDDILLVEDNPGDIRLTKETFRDGGLNPTFHVVTDGIEARDFLYRRGEYTDGPVPDVILLDWHLPRTNGGEILTELKQSEDLEDIPVVVLSGSGAEIDVLEEKTPRADEYFTKPLDPDEFVAVVDDC